MKNGDWDFILFFFFAKKKKRCIFAVLKKKNLTTQKNIALGFIVDKLTNSIENAVTGDSFPTDIILTSARDLISIMKKNTISVLDVDFIGDQEQPITDIKLKMISDYFQKKKATKRLKTKNKVAVAT
jgi:hypothetical protein